MNRLAAIAALALALGCHRGPDFSDYARNVQRVAYVTVGAPQPVVDLGHKGGGNLATLAARGIGGSMLEARLDEKLRAVQPAAVGDALSSSLRDALALRLRFSAVVAPTPCDAWIETSIQDFGVRADAPDRLPFVVLDARAVMYDCAARSAVWDGTVQFVEPITNPYFRLERISPSAGVVANLAALEALTPQEWSELFRAAATTAGMRLAEQLVQAATHPH